MAVAVAEVDAYIAKAAKLRQAEHKVNLQTIQDAGESLTAVAQALTVLKEFFATTGDATALVQQPMPPSFIALTKACKMRMVARLVC